MILYFRGEHRYLSNFEHSPIEYRGAHWPTVEHAYQAMKSEVPDEQVQIRRANSPGEAKRMGRLVILRPDWEEVKVQIMRELLWQKFSPKTHLREKLLGTGLQTLIEGNNWGDTYWGATPRQKNVVPSPPECIWAYDVEIDKNLVGYNKLGQLLMATRTELTFQKKDGILVP